MEIFIWMSVTKTMLASPNTKTLGWVGLGIMGKSMCQHCLKAGYKVSVYNRSWKSDTLETLKSLGAEVCASPGSVAKASDIVFTIVGFPKDVESVGSEVIVNLKPGGILVDMTTSKPELAVRLYEKGVAHNVSVLDAPVSGGDIGARDANLSIMCGGESEAFETVYPIFELMGKNIRHMGTSGMGQHTKMANQILIATNLLGVVEGLLYSQKAGLDLEKALAAIRDGAAGSWSLSNLGPRILKRNFDPGFMVEHFVKDLEIALDECRRMDLSLPGLALSHQLYVSLKAQGSGRMGIHALTLALEKINNLNINK